jgi:uncharacterized OsmC-like protein
MSAGEVSDLVRVSEADPSGFRQHIDIGGRHQLIADEPLALGGTDAGPTPLALVAAALGACTTITLRMYARRKDLPLAQVSCEISHRRERLDHADQAAGMVDVFERQIRLEGDLSEAQVERLLAIADKCPVHRMLVANSRVKTTYRGA